MIRFVFGRLTLLVSIIIFIQNISFSQALKKTNYDVLWKKVDSLAIKKGLTASALKEVSNIYTIAKKEKNDEQLIKALIYQVSLQQTTNDDQGEKNISYLDSEIKTLAEPAKSIANSLAAQYYWDYFQNNRWKFYNRTATVDYQKNDIATWSMDDFHKRTSELYLSSIKDEKLLQQTRLESFEAIIIKGNKRSLRPTLYDLLANRALEYFKTGERYITMPTQVFEINQASAFDPAVDFFSRKFPTKDSASLLYHALLIYQKLILFHLYDKTPDALIDADLNRLQFVKQYASMSNSDQLYFMAISHVAEQYQQTPAAAQAWFLLAQWHMDKGSTYNPFKDTTNRYALITAKKICETVILQREESEGKANCQNLITQLTTKTLRLSSEKVNIPGQPFRTLVQYRGFSKLYFRLILLNDEMRKKFQDNYDDTYWQRLVQLKATKTWSQAIPETNDYQEHSTEIKIDGLPTGGYVLLGSTTEDFTLKRNPLSAQYFDVSNISYVNSQDEYFALHRETGKPLVNAKIQTWYRSYDYNIRKETLSKGNLLQSDNNGYFKVKGLKLNSRRDRVDMRLEITYEKDHLFLENDFMAYAIYEDESEKFKNSKAYEEANAQLFFFTDRSIYRPGQVIYFKAIAVTEDFDTRRSKVYGNVKSNVLLQDANGQIIDSISVTTNEYGSYSGKFTIPENLLNGTFALRSNSIAGGISFSVEEYKRPKFIIEYRKLKGTYRLNDSITVAGVATAYAGNNIGGALVKYRVTREARFIYPWLYGGKGLMPQVNDMEITNGTTTTDKDGNFRITFKAIPDNSVKKTLDPVFDYNVTAEITDINGETRNEETTISVSYKALQLAINLQPNASVSVDSLKILSITSKNMNGEYEASKVTLRIFKLQNPNRLIRTRYWQQPDQFVMSKDEYLKFFPNDEYSDEKKVENWARGEKIVDQVDSTKENTTFIVQHAKLSTGWYAVEVSTQDKYGETVKDLKYILAYDEKSNQAPAKEYISLTQKNNILEPGEQSQIIFSSSANDLFLIQQIEKPLQAKNSEEAKLQNSGSKFSFIKLNNEQQKFSFPISEADRGGLRLTYFFVKDNRFYYWPVNLTIPWSNKELTVSYETFRDKLLPGSEESWKIKISGYKKEKVAAELLLGMYDASLDQFKSNIWLKPSIWESNYSDIWKGVGFQRVISQLKYNNEDLLVYFDKRYDVINTNVFTNWNGVSSRPVLSASKGEAARELALAPTAVADQKLNLSFNNNMEKNKRDGELLVQDVQLEEIREDVPGEKPNANISIRKNFNETAFFLPDLKTDSSGNISFSFTMPEALTQWKFQALAHTKDLAFGYSTKNIITQKELMLQPNAPRFLREGDRIELSSKVVNMSEKELTGTVQLELLNASNMQPVDGWFENMYPTQYFTAETGKSAVVNFTIQIPYLFNGAVIYRFKAISGNYADGEEAALPVVSNRMLVTESMPLNMRGSTSKSFKFEKLLQSGGSETLQHQAFTVEFTSNPTWYAVQALPYLTDFPYECAEQTFNRYYANALASMIVNKAPRLKAIVEKWNTTDTAALMSNLQKNQELKSILLQETPWVLEAKTEAQQKKNIALLFDMIRMNRDLASSFEKIKQMQSENGGFTWFKGGPDDRYITQYIITSLGHLKKLGALSTDQQKLWQPIQTKAISYLDARINDDYKALLRSKADLKKNQLGYTAIQYLYMRSFYPTIGIPGTSLAAVSFYRKQSQQFWLQQNRYMQGMIALNLSRTGDTKTANDILRSLKENAIVNDELGMYWKENKSGYYWYQAPTETQSLLIEAFSEISKDNKITDDLKTWLLKQKQTQNWSTTKATADACYALLLQGSDWLQDEPIVKIVAGDKQINSSSEKQEAGTGYFKKTFDGSFVNNSMGNIQVTVEPSSKTTATTWGAVYWQYFENLDKITPAATPLSLKKKLFIEKASDKGPVLQPIAENAFIKVGDKVKVRIELRVDRDMEYVHMKDMRASCMEPVTVLSEYKWQGGLGYYESTKDASTNFFFHWLPKGTYVFEYALFASQSGNFSNGVTSIQCMYAPEFSSHSEGVRVNVEK